MNRVYLLLIVAALTGLDSRPALASHLEGLRGAGEGLAVSTFWLSVGAILGFLVLGSLIVLGLRHLHRREGQSGQEEPW